MQSNRKKGFTLLFAALVGALVLAVGMAILGITIKQLALASASKATQQAFYSADAGIECALYLDRGAGLPDCRLGFFYAPNNDAGLSHQYSGAWSCLDEHPEYRANNNIRCMGKVIDLNQNGGPEITNEYVRNDFLLENGNTHSGDTASLGGPATHENMCFSVTVTKMADNASSLPGATIIESRGYNTCNTNAQNRFERAIRSVNYQ